MAAILRIFVGLLLLVAVLLVAIFALNNTTPMSVDLWGFVQLELEIGTGLIIAFLLGALSCFAVFSAALWAAKAKLRRLQFQLAKSKN